MEKICIVKRRNNIYSELQKEDTYALVNNCGLHSEENYVFEEPDENKNHDLSFNLTPEQSESIRSNHYIKSLLNGEANSFVLNMQKEEKEQTVFKFHFRESDTVQLLKTKEVCHMLQVSSGFLMKLVKGKRLKSYKLGRLRRFSLEDILNYLTENNEK
jgi:excisionase family DNA binding protein